MWAFFAWDDDLLESWVARVEDHGLAVRQPARQHPQLGEDNIVREEEIVAVLLNYWATRLDVRATNSSGPQVVSLHRNLCTRKLFINNSLNM